MIFLKFRVIAWLLLVVLMAFGLFSVQLLLEQRTLAEKTVRLHIVANSDSDADQAQKLRVRDAVLRCAGALTAQCSDAAEARSVLTAHLPEIEQAAQRVLDAEHSAYRAEALLRTEEFETRVYDTFSLPAGKYPTLRVNIGSAQGQN